jgi:hypothetical protein
VREGPTTVFAWFNNGAADAPEAADPIATANRMAFIMMFPRVTSD